jgi:hypothetical protein
VLEKRGFSAEKPFENLPFGTEGWEFEPLRVYF